MTDIAEQLITSTQLLSKTISSLSFSAPVTHWYNPLEYAWQAHERYLRHYGNTKKKIIFLGMNPGPFGMVQTGVPFGEIKAVRNWLKLDAKIEKPTIENPHRPIQGFDCSRTEISGQRLWDFFAAQFGQAENFFSDHFVANYCPLAFFNGGKNLTPDKLAKKETDELYKACDHFLSVLVDTLKAEWLVGIGGFAEQRAKIVLATKPANSTKIGKILHPSPASPVANRGFAEAAHRQLLEQGIWLKKC